MRSPAHVQNHVGHSNRDPQYYFYVISIQYIKIYMFVLRRLVYFYLDTFIIKSFETEVYSQSLNCRMFAATAVKFAK